MQKVIVNPKDDNFNVTNIKIEQLIPNTFDNILITIFEGHHTLDLPKSMVGLEFKNWLRTRGGIFSKDVLKFTRNKEHGQYVLYEGLKNKFIARLIKDEELLTFESLKLVDGHFKDVPYMILKDVDDENCLTSIKRYIEVSSDDIQNDVVISSHDSDNNDEEAISYNSVSLFSE